MRRIVNCLAAVAALAISSAAQAGHTAPELHVFFGTPAVNPVGAPTASDDNLGNGVTDNPSIDAYPGDIVCLPIMVRMVGNASQDLRNIVVELFGTGDTNMFSHAGNGAFDIYQGGGAPGVQGGGGPGSGGPPTAAGANVPGAGIQMMAPMFATRNTADPTSLFNTADGIRILGYVYFQVSNSASDGDMLTLRFSNSNDAARQNVWGVAQNANQTIAYGWDAGNVEGDGDGLNSWRLQDTNNDVVTGTTNGHQSTLGDAKINVIPEPATMGLLGLGLLAIRRRRA